MTDLDRQARAEALLLVGIAERQCSSSWLDGALDLAAHTGLLPADRIGWLAELRRGFDDPEAVPALAPERRAAYAQLLRDRDIELVDEVRIVGERLGLEEELVLEEDDEVEALIGFKGVVPGPPERDGKRVISLECYDGGLLLRYEVAHEVPEDLRDKPPGELHEHFLDLEVWDHAEIDDDLGTHYDQDGGGGSAGIEGDRWVSSSRYRFSTPLPQGARRLTVHLSGTRFELDVTGIAERPAT